MLCLHCKSEISDVVKKCKFCGEWVENGQNISENQNSSQKEVAFSPESILLIPIEQSYRRWESIPDMQQALPLMEPAYIIELITTPYSELLLKLKSTAQAYNITFDEEKINRFLYDDAKKFEDKYEIYSYKFQKIMQDLHEYETALNKQTIETTAMIGSIILSLVRRLFALLIISAWAVQSSDNHDKTKHNNTQLLEICPAYIELMNAGYQFLQNIAIRANYLISTWLNLPYEFPSTTEKKLLQNLLDK